MRLPRASLNVSTSALLLSFLLVSNAVAQNLPKLPGSSAAAATTSTDSTTSKTTDKTTASTTTSGAASTTTDAPGLTGLPKLAGDNYPPPTVPPTADAPYMQKSNLPEGTVFICVGAGLGFLGFMVLAWRGLVAWSLHRSVKRAAMAQSAKYHVPGRDPRAAPSKGSKSPYFSPGPGSTLSLDHLGASGKGAGSKHNSAYNSLYFSPTAGAGMHTPSNRGSGYLPAGYYAAGNSAPSGMTHIGGSGMPLSNLGNQGRRYSRTRSAGHSPPRSPSLPPSRGGDSLYNGRPSTQGLTQGLTMHASNSSLNVAPTQSRAPSAYLEDLFENHPPGQVPEEFGRR